MCLDVSKKSEVLIAKEDIVVYKYLKGYNYANIRKYITPFRGVSVNIGDTYYSELFAIKKTSGSKSVEIGLHSFRELGAARNSAEAHLWRSEPEIAKCIIPKGAKYFKGKFNNRVSYASDSLKYIELLNI